MADTLSQEELEALKKRRREEEKQAEAMSNDPGDDHLCTACS